MKYYLITSIYFLALLPIALLATEQSFNPKQDFEYNVNVSEKVNIDKHLLVMELIVVNKSALTITLREADKPLSFNIFNSDSRLIKSIEQPDTHTPLLHMRKFHYYELKSDEKRTLRVVADITEYKKSLKQSENINITLTRGIAIEKPYIERPHLIQKKVSYKVKALDGS